ncbi:MAG: hypothetical protein QM775_17410 [Pirellulales bacterium]
MTVDDDEMPSVLRTRGEFVGGGRRSAEKFCGEGETGQNRKSAQFHRSAAGGALIQDMTDFLRCASKMWQSLRPAEQKEPDP